MTSQPAIEIVVYIRGGEDDPDIGARKFVWCGDDNGSFMDPASAPTVDEIQERLNRRRQIQWAVKEQAGIAFAELAHSEWWS